MSGEFLTKKTLQALSLRDAINHVLEHGAKVDTSNSNSVERFYNNVLAYAKDHSVNGVFSMRSEVVEEFHKYGILCGKDLTKVIRDNAELITKEIPFAKKIVTAKKKKHEEGAA